MRLNELGIRKNYRTPDGTEFNFSSDAISYIRRKRREDKMRQIRNKNIEINKQQEVLLREYLLTLSGNGNTYQLVEEIIKDRFRLKNILSDMKLVRS